MSFPGCLGKIWQPCPGYTWPKKLISTAICNCMKHKMLCNCLFFFFFLFFFQPYLRLQNSKLVFLILKVLQYGRSRWWVQLFPRYPCKNWYKKWYLHFYKTYNHQIWQAGTSTRFDSNETNQASVDDVITSRSCDKRKAYLHYQSSYGHQTWQHSNVPWWVPAHKITWPFITWS